MDGEAPDAPASTAPQAKGSARPLPGKVANVLNATPVMPYVTSPATTPIKAGRNGKVSLGKGETVAADSPPITPLQKVPLSGLGFALDPPVTPAPSSRLPLGSPWLKPASGVELLAALQSDAGVLISGMPQPQTGRLPLSQLADSAAALQLPIAGAEPEPPPLDRQPQRTSTRSSGAGGLTPAAALAAAPPTSRELRNSTSFAALCTSRSESLGASAEFAAGLRVSGAGAGLLVSPKGAEGGGAAASPTQDSTGGLMVSPGGDRSFSGAGITGIEARRMHRQRSISQAAQATHDTRPESSQGAQPCVGEQPPGRSCNLRLAPARSGVAPHLSWTLSCTRLTKPSCRLPPSRYRRSPPLPATAAPTKLAAALAVMATLGARLTAPPSRCGAGSTPYRPLPPAPLPRQDPRPVAPCRRKTSAQQVHALGCRSHSCLHQAHCPHRHCHCPPHSARARHEAPAGPKRSELQYPGFQ